MPCLSREKVILGIDLGTERIKVIKGVTGRKPRITGMAQGPLLGFKKGFLAEPDAVVRCLGQVLEQLDGKEEPDAVFLAIGSPRVCRYFPDKVPEGERDLVVLPSEPDFWDDREDVKRRWRVLSRVGLQTENLILAPRALTWALQPHLGEGVFLILDIGGQVTTFAAVQKGEPRDLGVIPVGSNHITADLTFALRVGREEAEDIKRYRVDISPDRTAEYDYIKIHRPDGSKERVTREFLGKVVTSRVEEIFQLVARRLEKAGVSRTEIKEVALTGGGAALAGLEEVTANFWQATAYRGEANVPDAPDFLRRDPSYTVALGMVGYALRNSPSLPEEESSGWWDGIRKRLKAVLGS